MSSGIRVLRVRPWVSGFGCACLTRHAGSRLVTHMKPSDARFAACASFVNSREFAPRIAPRIGKRARAAPCCARCSHRAALTKRASHEAAPRPCAQHHSACAGPRRRAAHRVPILKYLPGLFQVGTARAGAARQGRSRGPHCARLRTHIGARARACFVVDLADESANHHRMCSPPHACALP